MHPVQLVAIQMMASSLALAASVGYLWPPMGGGLMLVQVGFATFLGFVVHFFRICEPFPLPLESAVTSMDNAFQLISHITDKLNRVSMWDVTLLRLLFLHLAVDLTLWGIIALF